MAGTLIPSTPPSSSLVVPQFQYLGAYTVAPTTRPNGSTLQSGDFYFNETDTLVYVWDAGTAAFISMISSGGGASAAAILALLLTVDGAGSGLDADLLDGNHAAAFEAADAAIQAHITAVTGNPHAVTAAQAGAEPANANIQGHIADTSNPHSVTAAQAGAKVAAAVEGIATGGTGQTTAQAAIDALTAVSGATNEHVLTKDTATGNAMFKAAAGGGSSGLPTGYIQGLIATNDATDATNDLSISAGKCRYDDDSADFTLAALQIKQADATWATGSNAGGLSSSLTFALDTVYYIFAMTVGGTNEIGIDTSSTGANLVTDHSATIVRMLGKRRTKTASAAWETITARETAGGGEYVRFANVAAADWSGTSSTAATLRTLRAPPLTRAILHATFLMTVAGDLTFMHRFFATDETNNSVSGLNSQLVIRDGSRAYDTAEFELNVDASSQIYHRASLTTGTLYIMTHGYVDDRRV